MKHKSFEFIILGSNLHNCSTIVVVQWTRESPVLKIQCNLVEYCYPKFDLHLLI